MRNIVPYGILLLFLGGCVGGGPGISAPIASSGPVPTATLPSVSNPDLLESNCPLIPLGSDGHLTRLYHEGQCLLRFLPAADSRWSGVILKYPAGWKVSVVNEPGTALLFERNERVFFVQFYQSDLPLERADEVSAVSGAVVEAAVHPEESVKERSLIEVEDRLVLLLTTVFGEQNVRRYFVKETPVGKAPVIVLFQITVTAPNLDNSAIIPIVEAMIADLRFEQ